MTRLSMELELSDLQQMAISRYGIRAVGSIIGIREIVTNVVSINGVFVNFRLNLLFHVQITKNDLIML